MKFVSKSSNLQIILRPGIPGSAIAGREPISGIYVRFQDGIAVINDSEKIEMMLKHPGFERDFIIVDELQKDPFAYKRSEIEPGHIIQEVKYGHVENAKSSVKAPPLTPQMNKLIEDLASARIKEMLPGIIETTVKKMVEAQKQKLSEVDSDISESVQGKELKQESKDGDFEKNVDVNKVLGIQPEPIEANEAFTDELGVPKLRKRGRPPLEK